eukprot:COSAG05_NODE_1339_length_5145_cov_5.141102_2_plen_199_part_00
MVDTNSLPFRSARTQLRAYGTSQPKCRMQDRAGNPPTSVKWSQEWQLDTATLASCRLCRANICVTGERTQVRRHNVEECLQCGELRERQRTHTIVMQIRRDIVRAEPVISAGTVQSVSSDNLAPIALFTLPLRVFVEHYKVTNAPELRTDISRIRPDLHRVGDRRLRQTHTRHCGQTPSDVGGGAGVWSPVERQAKAL